MAFTPDGTEIVICGDDGTTRVWDRRTGQLRHALGVGGMDDEAVAVTPDGAEIVTGDSNGIVQIWNRRSGELRATLYGHSDSICAIGVTPDGAEIVTGGGEHAIIRWDRHQAIELDVIEIGNVRSEHRDAGPDSREIPSFACAGCGARIEFAAGTDRLQCPYCRYEQELPAQYRKRLREHHIAELTTQPPVVVVVAADQDSCPRCGGQADPGGCSPRSAGTAVRRPSLTPPGLDGCGPRVCCRSPSTSTGSGLHCGSGCRPAGSCRAV